MAEWRPDASPVSDDDQRRISDAEEFLSQQYRKRLGEIQKRISDAEEFLSRLKSEREDLQRRLGVLTAGKEPSASKGQPDSTAESDVSSQINREASTTGEVARQVLLLHGGEAMKLDFILLEARKFNKWNATGDNERDKQRLDSALRRGKGKIFRRTKNGWELIERLQR